MIFVIIFVLSKFPDRIVRWIVPFLFCGILLFSTHSHATHIRGGNITYTVISTDPMVVLFKVSLYRDSNGLVQIGGGTLDFWDGTAVNLRANADSIHVDYLGNQIEEYVFYISHEYPRGTNYIAPFYLEGNRNGGTVNLLNSASLGFLIETEAYLLPGGTVNNSPVFQIPPNDEGVVRELFIHNVGAFDIDGDSLAYELITPFQQKGIEVQFYDLPDSSWIDVFGNLHWDEPVFVGQYTYVIKVTEWRKVNGVYQQIGFVIRDMQIFIRDLPNEPPEIEPNGLICVIAGETASMEMTVTDPNDSLVTIELFQSLNLPAGAYEEFPSWNEPLAVPVDIRFDWHTECSYVRGSPYPFYFKATDNYPSSQLSSIAVWNVEVAGPAPEWAQLDQSDHKARLQWNPSCENTDRFEIWKSVGPTSFEPVYCEGGIPDNVGYEKVAEVAAMTNVFLDSMVSRGATYCYRIVGVWKDGARGMASEERCVTIPVDAPVITHVSVRETADLNGEIALEWSSSFDLPEEVDQSQFTYQVWISDSTEMRLVASTTDTALVADQLSTINQGYEFSIRVLDNGALRDSSDRASSVFLQSSSEQSEILLRWEYEVPWSNASSAYPFHYIYRNRVDTLNPDTFILLDSVNLLNAAPEYLDVGSADEPLYGTYRYYVVTQGTYGTPGLPAPLRNASQIVEQLAIDNTPPCAPTISILNASEADCISMVETLGCSEAEFYNELGLAKGCDDRDFSHYNIYFRSAGTDEFGLLSTARSDMFSHGSLQTLAGCYFLTAVDFSGNESNPSETVCRENCLTLLLPNIFTPNGDGRNDYFALMETRDGKPVSCSPFVKSMEVLIVNRAGVQVYKSTITDPERFSRLWDGRDQLGNKMPAGTYYYHVSATYNAVDTRQDELEGWVDMLY